MTVLLNNNFDATADGVLTGWTVAQGAALVVGALSVWGLTAVSGTKGYARNSNGDSTNNTALGVLTDQAIRFDQKILSKSAGAFGSMSANLRSNSDGNTTYRLYLETNGTALRAVIVLFQSGSTILASSSYTLTPSPSDVVHLEARAVGVAIELRAWLNSGARPTTTTATATEIAVLTTDSVIASGYASLRVSADGANWAAADNLVITDGAGGEGFYDPAPPSAALSWTEGAEVFALSGSVVVSGIAVAAAWTEGAETTAIASTVSAAMGTITTRIIKNNTGFARTNLANCAINIYNATTGALVLHLAGLTSNSSGRLVVTNAAIVAGTSYAYEIDLTAASMGRRLPVALAA